MRVYIIFKVAYQLPLSFGEEIISYKTERGYISQNVYGSIGCSTKMNILVVEEVMKILVDLPL